MKSLTVLVWLAAIPAIIFAWWPQAAVAVSEQTTAPIIQVAINPEEIAGCRIAHWEPLTNQAQVLQLSKNLSSGQWQLPGYADYPADAGEAIGSLAGRLLQLEFGLPVVIDDLTAVQLIDPLRVDQETPERAHAAGTRLTLFNQQQEPLVDVVLGSAVRDNPEQRYIRQVRIARMFL